MTDYHGSTHAAIEAMRHGFTAVPIRAEEKAPGIPSWGHLRWEDEDSLITAFEQYADQGLTNIGLLLGESHGNLVDVDLDHPKALKLRDYFLPPTAMMSGRPARPRSHYWYVVDGPMPEYRKYTLPDGSTLVELRSSKGPMARHQTVIPPSIWSNAKLVDKNPGTKLKRERYRWEGPPFGGEVGPTHVDGKVLSVQVALLALGATLLDAWPEAGSRHEAYLALAGGLLRFGDGPHPWWKKNLPVLIAALADADNDEDGPEQRVHEVMGTTLTKLSEGGKVSGFPTLAEIIGPDHAETVRRRAKDVEVLAGFVGKPITRIDPNTGEVMGRYEASEAGDLITEDEALDAGTETVVADTLDPETRNPMEERISSWAAVDLEPYLRGLVVLPEPSVLTRSDGKSLFYPGLVNSLYGPSESAKSWIALGACVQEISKGERVMYIDFEDVPEGTLARIQAMGVGDYDIQNQFRYVHPEGPIADMQRSKFGARPTDDGQQSAAVFKALLDSYDPTLIICDGMTVIYGLHALDSNDAMSTDVITTWLKSITRGGRTTVIVIDHTGKQGGPGASPIGAHHKVAMVQGSALRADPISRPMRGAVGKVSLTVYKDRPGAVRAISNNPGAREQVCAVVTIDSSQEDVTKLTVDPPKEIIGDSIEIGGTPETERGLERISRAEQCKPRVLEMLEKSKWVTTSHVQATLDIGQNTVYEIWRILESEGLVVKSTDGRSKRAYALKTKVHVDDD